MMIIDRYDSKNTYDKDNYNDNNKINKVMKTVK